MVEFILIYKQLRASSLGQAISVIEERIRERKIPPHLIEAVISANGQPNRLGSINLSRGTLYRWVRAYRLADGNPLGLAPVPTKTLYANDNVFGRNEVNSEDKFPTARPIAECELHECDGINNPSD
ncbi:hypothetical protein [Aliiroseovarius marinus]|uniref:hypothetical protein n=1 Tax=Aliiroseovarius marinus TaxID=2500159 RepID=UPI003D7DDF21